MSQRRSIILCTGRRGRGESRSRYTSGLKHLTEAITDAKATAMRAAGAAGMRVAAAPGLAFALALPFGFDLARGLAEPLWLKRHWSPNLQRPWACRRHGSVDFSLGVPRGADFGVEPGFPLPLPLVLVFAAGAAEDLPWE